MTPDETVVDLRLTTLEKRTEAQEQRVGRSMEVAARHEEQINGDRGLSQGVKDVADEVRNLRRDVQDEVQSLRRALYSFGGAIVLAAVTFALTVGQGHL